MTIQISNQATAKFPPREMDYRIGAAEATGHVGGPLLVWLNDGVVERELVGGKGASLSRLTNLGARVPPAFALTTHAYEAFADGLGLPRSANDVSDADLPDLRARIESAPLPSVVAELVASQFAVCQAAAGGSCAVAVRSSATAEDSPEFSFAGLHDTILDVRDLAGLERAITQCWASLWSDRAVSYRRAGGIEMDAAVIAVVVQQLIRSDVSFVVFTADPVSGHDQHLVIAATWGLGEAVVSGLVVPDHIVIGVDGEVIEHLVGNKHLMVIPGVEPGDGVREIPVPRALRNVPVMSEAQAKEIGAVARSLSNRLGFAADIEGAFCGGELYLLQARPITTLGSNTRKATVR
jgi:phosphoenolpyruvate synthase/pyruvate phosphate dikinase